MRETELVIRLKLPSLRTWRWLVVVAVFVVSIAVAHAYDPSWIVQGQPISANAMLGTFNELNSRIATLEMNQGALVPAGTVVAFAGPVVPTGWLLCDGSLVARATYPTLFSAIGTASGSGDGASTFNLPDYRGMFLRGVESADPNSRDPDTGSRVAAAPGGNAGNLVGSVEAGGFASHNHVVRDPGHIVPLNDGTGFMTQMASGAQVCAAAGGGWCIGLSNNATQFTGVYLDPSGGNETRPVNAYVNYIIKT